MTLRFDMTAGKASDAKAADGDAPVFAYIASLPQPQRDIAEQIDALAARTLPGLRRAVKWGMAYYGVDGGWCFTSGAFVGHVKLMFIRGTEQPKGEYVAGLDKGQDIGRVRTTYGHGRIRVGGRTWRSPRERTTDSS